MRRPGEDQREEDRRRAVVDQALGLDQEPQPAGYAGFAQERDHRDRVGRGDQRAEDERGLDRPAEPVVHPAGDDRSAERNADSRQRDARAQDRA